MLSICMDLGCGKKLWAAQVMGELLAIVISIAKALIMAMVSLERPLHDDLA